MMDDQERGVIYEKILEVIHSIPADEDGWVEFARIGAPLTAAGVQYRQYGFPKLRPFLNEFQDELEFREEQIDDKPPVCYVRLRGEDTGGGESVIPEKTAATARRNIYRKERVPSQDAWLYSWASIQPSQIEDLSNLALEERWYYGDARGTNQEDFPILKNYLAYTFKRLCSEGKVLIQKDPERQEESEEYAAFNTGLVDKKYEYIYALFKKNTREYPRQYWYLLDFAVAGEDVGKTLVKVFNPLPGRADYFENKIQNMLYDTSTGDLSCDYIHIITERTERLPLEFLKENCPPAFLFIDGTDIDEVYFKPSKDEKRKTYFLKLGEKIKDNSRILNRLKNRIEDAVDLALKRVEWNYKTAIPMYYPAKKRGSLLLPLALVDEDRVDLALVVERLFSGSYQGQTILPLNLAYGNSRLVARPDSDWLKTDLISMADPDDMDDSE